MLVASCISRIGSFALFGLLSLTAGSLTASAQRGRTDSVVSATVASMLVRYGDALGDTTELSRIPTFTSQEDSLDWVAWRERASRAEYPLQIVISLFDRTLHVLRSGDTAYTAPIAVASGTTLEYAGRTWTFRTPRGKRTVLRKIVDPVWTPPDWLYAEVASSYGLKLERLHEGSSVALRYGYRLTVRNGVVGVVHPDSRRFQPLPTDEHVVFNSTLFIPPYGTHNRRVAGELGAFALDMGSGYLIHGTPDENSIGRAVTHGCIRLADVDIAWMYENVPTGTPVFIY